MGVHYADKNLSQLYDDYASNPESCYSFHADTILNLAEILDNSKRDVCEIGAGTGATTLKLLGRLNDSSFALISEPDDSMRNLLLLNVSRNGYLKKNFEIVNSTGEEIAAKTDNKFYSVVSNFTLLHINLETVLENASQLLQPKGSFVNSFFSVIIDPASREDFYNEFDRRVDEYSRNNSINYQTPFRVKFGYDGLNSLAKKTGFGFEYQEAYREEPKELFEQAFGLFIQRNFSRCISSGDGKLPNEERIEIMKDIAERTYNSLGKFEYGVTFLKFTKN